MSQKDQVLLRHITDLIEDAKKRLCQENSCLDNASLSGRIGALEEVQRIFTTLSAFEESK